MSKRVSPDDASVLLYIVPFAASGIYALYLWMIGGISSVLPASVYLTVTRDPYLFLAGTLSVMLGVVLEVSSTSPAGRSAKLGSVGNTLQTIAAASFILALVCAFYANGFSDIPGVANDFLVGRYSLVFPAVLVLFSYLVTARFNIASLRTPTFLGIIAMLLVPVSMYGIGRRSPTVGLVAGLALVLVGIALFMISSRKVVEQEKGKSLSK